ncbi:MAG: peptidoglycan DD-metalloendopeptidase family protein [Pseudomonadota bacterium]
MRCLHSFGALLLAVVGATAAPGGHAQTEPASSAGWKFSPLVEAVQAPPRWFTGSDGRTRLVYELLLSNAMTLPAKVSEVEVRDARSGAVLIKLTGAPLLEAMSLAPSPTTPTVDLPPATLGVVWLDIPLPARAQIPSHLVHHLTIAAVPGVPASSLSFKGASVAVDQRRPVVLGPPLAGAGWHALGSCCDGPHRRAIMPIAGSRNLGQRFAIDFNQLDAQNRAGVGDPKLPASFPTFGQPVLAVADAKVVVAVDRYKDLLVDEAREEMTQENEGGNRVVLDLGNGRFAGYAHLQAGSVTVKPGQRVRRGQQIAKAGSSGTDGGPHVHFQVMDRPSMLRADGLPFVFDSFLLTGQGPPLAEAVKYYDTLKPMPIDTQNAGPRRHALPLASDLVAFPARGRNNRAGRAN